MFESLGTVRLAFERPYWLLLLPVILPPLILVSMKSLAGLGKIRQTVAIFLRSTIVTLIILALAQLQMVQRNDSLTTIFLLDASQSLPRDWQAPMLQFVNNAIQTHQRPGDKAGVVVFGRDSKVESPPATYTATMTGIESTLDPEYTDIAGSLKLALATFPEDSAKRIVLLSDGNENRGNAYEQALAAAGLNVPIDVLPIEYRYDKEVLVEKIQLPADVKKGETVNINIVVRAAEPTRGKLQVNQTVDGSTIALDSIDVDLDRGVNVYSLKQTIDQPNFYTYTAQFIPDETNLELLRADRAINNFADGFTQFRGEANVLLIQSEPGEYDELVQALRERELEVTALTSGEIGGGGLVGGDRLPSDLSEFQKYDAVILANVPKDVFTDQQQDMLASVVHDQGIGLLMIGGDKSFGAGGWTGTPVEKALPVNMQIPALKVQGKAAMVLVMSASEMPEGNYWQKVVAKEALNTLSTYDYAGLISWQGQESWQFTLREIGPSRNAMLRAIDRMSPGDMPDYNPSLLMAMRALLARRDAMTRHLIMMCDGDHGHPTAATIRQIANAKITVTTVLITSHGNDMQAVNMMRNLAQQTRGRFYHVTNPRALPRIFQKEARLISRPLIYEGPPAAWAPVLEYQSEPLVGLPDELPSISGFVLTSVKENELVEVPIKSPFPTGQSNPILAQWTYGLGRSVAFTSDAGRKWATEWPNWDSYAAFWSQVVRWALRPVDQGNVTVALRREEGQIKVVVDALDRDHQFLNFLQFQGNVNRPDREIDAPAQSLELVQVAPGKYEGIIDNAEARGNYFVTLGYRGSDGVQGVITTGLSVPYSDEYRELQSNPLVLETLADVSGGEVLEWKYGPDGRPDVRRTVASADVFRRDRSTPPPRSFQDLWPQLLWLAACLFLADVAVRRIALDLDRMRKSVIDQWKKLRGQEVAPREEYIEKLKSRKAEVGEQIDRTRGATRFEAPPIPSAPTAPIGEPLLEGGDGERPRPSAQPKPTQPGLGPSERPAEEDSYTNRLLKAKKKVWEEREKGKGEGA